MHPIPGYRLLLRFVSMSAKEAASSPVLIRAGGGCFFRFKGPEPLQAQGFRAFCASAAGQYASPATDFSAIVTIARQAAVSDFTHDRAVTHRRAGKHPDRLTRPDHLLIRIRKIRRIAQSHAQPFPEEARGPGRGEWSLPLLMSSWNT